MIDILSGKTKKHLTSLGDYQIHQDVKESFLKLQKKAQGDGFNLQLISAFRSYQAQENIWNAKARGEKKLYSHDGRSILNFSDLNEEEIIMAIMRWSALPGASRHHWGTDIDVFDAHKKARDKVELTIEEGEPNGAFFEFHEWLTDLIQSDQSFGFYRPYEQDLGGVSPEKWHLSYSPISLQYYEKYTIDVFEQIIQESEILLKPYIEQNLQTLFDRFITNISHK